MVQYLTLQNSREVRLLANHNSSREIFFKKTENPELQMRMTYNSKFYHPSEMIQDSSERRYLAISLNPFNDHSIFVIPTSIGTPVRLSLVDAQGNENLQANVRMFFSNIPEYLVYRGPVIAEIMPELAIQFSRGVLEINPQQVQKLRDHHRSIKLDKETSNRVHEVAFS